MSKFLSSGSSGVQQLQDGTSYVNVSTAIVNNLAPNMPVKSSTTRELTSSLLSVSDLDFVPLANPFGGTLQASGDVQANYDTIPIGLVATNNLAVDALPKSGGSLTGAVNAGTNSIACGSFSCSALTTTSLGAGYVKSSPAGVFSSSAAIPQSDVTNLTTDLGARAPIANPTFTGTLTAPTIILGAADLDTRLTTDESNIATVLTRTQNLTADVNINVMSGSLGVGAVGCTSLYSSGTLSAAGVTSTGAISAGTNAISSGALTCSALTTTSLGAGYVKSSAGGLFSSAASIPQADVVNLTTDLGAKAPINNPTFTGTLQCGTLLASGIISSSGNNIVGGFISCASLSSVGTLSASTITTTGSIRTPTISNFGGAITCAGAFSAGTNAISGAAVSCSSLTSSGTLSAAGVTSTGAISAGTNAISGGAVSCSSLTSSGTLSAAGVTSTDAISAGTNAITCGSISCPAATAPSIATRLNLVNTGSAGSTITLSGAEYYQPANTSTEGIVLLPGVNRGGNRQLWVGDSALPRDTTSKALRVIVAGATAPDITAISTDGTLGSAPQFSQGLTTAGLTSTAAINCASITSIDNTIVNIQSTLVTAGPRAVITATPGTALTLTANGPTRSMPMPCTAQILSQFTLNTATGELTYTGTRTASVLVSITWSATFSANGGNATYILYDPNVAATRAVCLMNALNAAARVGSSASFYLQLATNQTIFLRMSILQTTETLTFTYMQITVTSLLE